MTESDLVTISRVEYEDLLQCRLKLASMLGWSEPKRRSTSKVYRDVELSRFVDDCIGRRLTYAATHVECIKKFGADRVPSVGSITRYAQDRG